VNGAGFERFVACLADGSHSGAQEETVAFRCTGKRLLPIFLASFVVPRLALKLVRD
jgi:hypothetical protein